MQNSQIRLLLVDDNLFVRKGLVHVLQGAPDIEVVGEAADGEEAMFLTRKLLPDIILMDVKMDGIGGIAATKQIVDRFPDIRIVALSTYADSETVSRMIDAGASGFLQKDISANELISAVRLVLDGKLLPEPNNSDDRNVELLDNKEKTPVELFGRFGEQQQKVLALLTKGFTNPEIAEKLGVSVPTARYHVSAILKKLEVSNRSEAVAMAVRNNLVTTDDFR